MDNYRQITIIEPVIKLLSSIAVVRVRRYVEARNLLGKEQAGFRQGEECAAHYAALLEIAQRQRLKNKPTYIAFLDIKKAFPSVPHECLFIKLEKIGIRGKLLILIKALFVSSSFRIRLGHLYSERGGVEKGIKQGDPISPDLFALFFKDIVKLGYDMGINLEGVMEEIAFLLYADDTAIIAEDRIKMDAMLAGAQKWITDQEMNFNTKKSAIVFIPGKNGNEDLTRDVKEVPFMLGAERVPVVDEYKYLGYNFRDSLKSKDIIIAREKVGRSVLSKIYPFINNKEIPLHAKLDVIRSFLIPVITYGGEFFGLGGFGSVNILENIVKDALRGVVMGSRGNAGAGDNLLKEFNIYPIEVIAAVARVRLFNKIVTNKFQSVVGILFGEDWIGRGNTWGNITNKWLLKRNLDAGGDKNPLLKEVRQLVNDEVWERKNKMLNQSNSLNSSGYVYTKFAFMASRDYIYQDKGTQFQNGLALLAGLRTGSFWSCLRLSKVFEGKYGEWKYKCPFCKVDQAEDIEHLIMNCSKWGNDREIMLAAIRDDWMRYDASCTPVVDRATLLGGVNDNGDTLMPIWLEGSSVEDSSQNKTMIAPLYLHVARFLDRIGERRRLELLKIQKLRVRQEVTNEAFPDQEIVSEGSEDDLNFQVMDELLEELEGL